MKIVIIGNGIAGNRVAFGVREGNKDHDICIVSAETMPEYDPCALPYFLGGDLRRGDVFRKTVEDYRRGDIDLKLGNRVEAIDPAAKCVTTDRGDEIAYDKLVLAHGGQQFIPPIEGIDMPGVFSCKQLSETERLHAHGGNCAVVIGSGAIGIEVAESLQKRGYRVTVVELLDWVLPALFDRETARRIEARLTAGGIRVLTSERVVAIGGEGKVAVVTTDKRTLNCDTVVIATGVVPGVSLAQTAGIDIDRGIKVNDRMETSGAGIYACGDCVETVDACTGEDVMFQLKHNAIDQAAVVAQNLLGERTGYAGAYAFARVHFHRTHAVTFGKTTQATHCELGQLRTVEKESGDDYLRLILKEDVIVGGQALGAYARPIGFFMGAMRRKDNFEHLRCRWTAVRSPLATHRWPQRLMGEVMGLRV